MKVKGVVALGLGIFLPLAASAQSRETLYEGMDMKLEASVDAMTDERSCALFVEQGGPTYLALYGPDDFAVWAAEDTRVNFAPDGRHLVRIGEASPYSLMALAQRNGLKPANAEEGAAVISALFSGERVRVRYYNWPSNEAVDASLSAPNLGYVYNLAVERCGWTDLGLSGQLAQAELYIYQPNQSGSEGYARVEVTDNRDLKLAKGFDKFGGGCHVQVGIKGVFGMQDGRWTSETVDTLERHRLIIRGASGSVIFSEKLPKDYGDQRRGNRWPLGEAAARTAWLASPEGSIELENVVRGNRVSLYGFREIWNWGIQNCQFPSVE